MYKMDLSKPLYVCGPMSNMPGYNVQAFLDAGQQLEAAGYKVQLPADLDDPEIVVKLLASPDGKTEASGMTWGDCLALDVKLISDVCGGVVVLPGWRKSKGARLETFVNYLHGRSSVYLKTMEEVPHEVLFAAWKGL